LKLVESLLCGKTNGTQGVNPTFVNAATRNGDIAIIATILEVPEELFRGNYLTVECLAHYDDFLFAKKEMALEKKDSTTSNQNSGRPGGSYGGRQSDGYDSSRDSSKVDRYGYEANRRQQGRYSQIHYLLLPYKSLTATVAILFLIHYFANNATHGHGCELRPASSRPPPTTTRANSVAALTAIARARTTAARTATLSRG
jgi:hypothetical protein